MWFAGREDKMSVRAGTRMRAVCTARAATVVDLPAWREQQRRMELSVDRRRSRCQGSGANPWAVRMSDGSSIRAMVRAASMGLMMTMRGAIGGGAAWEAVIAGLASSTASRASIRITRKQAHGCAKSTRPGK